MSCGTPRRANQRSMSRRSSGVSVVAGDRGVVTAGDYSTGFTHVQFCAYDLPVDGSNPDQRRIRATHLRNGRHSGHDQIVDMSHLR